MKILVDADSCPGPARDLLLRTAARTGVKTIFAANRLLPGVGGGAAVMELCPPGKDSADNRIFNLAEKGDLAITRDVPLASRLVEASVTVMDDRGRVYTGENIRERLSLRNFMVGLAENGLGADRSANYGRKELKAMADSLDRFLAQTKKKERQKNPPPAEPFRRPEES
ncbi:MAG: DUF188 domain-containing protein [Treponema sp.]|nr:DUF188 domain-containing protein [Treponema sp.]